MEKMVTILSPSAKRRNSCHRKQIIYLPAAAISHGKYYHKHSKITKTGGVEITYNDDGGYLLDLTRLDDH